MGLLESCCGCISLRRGSFLVAFYSIIYFSIFSYLSGPGVIYETILRFDTEGWQNWLANQTFNESDEEPIIEEDEEFANPIFYILSIVDFFTEVLGVVFSLFLIVGLIKDESQLLVPWLIVVPLHTIIDTFMVIFIVIDHTQDRSEDPWEIAFKNIPLLILDLTLNVLNVYTILCVLSQYQEYKMGRGTSAYQAYLRRQDTNELSGMGVPSNRSGGSTNVGNRSSGKCEIWLEDLGLKKDLSETEAKKCQNNSEVTKSFLKPHSSIIKNSPSMRSNYSSIGLEDSTIETETAPELLL